MIFLISLALALLLVLLLGAPLRKHPLPFYLAAAAIALCVVVCTFSGIRFPGWFSTWVWPVFARGALAGALCGLVCAGVLTGIVSSQSSVVRAQAESQPTGTVPVSTAPAAETPAATASPTPAAMASPEPSPSEGSAETAVPSSSAAPESASAVETVPPATAAPSAAALPAAVPTQTAEPAPEPTPQPTPETPRVYRDGTYTGAAAGNLGTADDVVVSVTIENDRIVSIVITGFKDDPDYFDPNVEGSSMIGAMLSSQSANVDGISEATYSSEGLRNAVRNALSKARN